MDLGFLTCVGEALHAREAALDACAARELGSHVERRRCRHVTHGQGCSHMLARGAPGQMFQRKTVMVFPIVSYFKLLPRVREGATTSAAEILSGDITLPARPQEEQRS